MGDSGGESDEQPEHEITISPFVIDKFEVTEEQYESCVKAKRCTPAHYDDMGCLAWSGKSFQKVKVPPQYRNPGYPVVCVTWYQAQAYCKWNGKQLPSEARWEYAARAGKRSTYAWGSGSPSKQTCADAKNKHPDKAGSHPANGWGLFDMTGNAWEWTSDNYCKDQYLYSEKKDPAGPATGLYKVIRGGGWYSGPKQLRISNRHWFSPGFAEVSIGFRCSD